MEMDEQGIYSEEDYPEYESLFAFVKEFFPEQINIFQKTIWRRNQPYLANVLSKFPDLFPELEYNRELIDQIVYNQAENQISQSGKSREQFTDICVAFGSGKGKQKDEDKKSLMGRS